MLGRPSGMALAISFIGTSTTRAPDSVTIGGGSPPRGSLITNVCGPDFDFGAEAVGVEPVDADHQVELVGQTFDRMHGKAQQPSRFAAADLRAHGAGKQPMPSCGAGRLEQEVPGGQGAGAAAANDRDRNTRRGCHGVCLLHHGRSRAAAANMYLSTRMRFFAFP